MVRGQDNLGWQYIERPEKGQHIRVKIPRSSRGDPKYRITLSKNNFVTVTRYTAPYLFNIAWTLLLYLLSSLVLF